ncbi:EutN/CcmL family microcompartment protein [Fictibacillus terranigra]|uniref:EutN/CcmL family microcompartment protein n=1 Tax=Fictibacillus terranigra TaxID=3058424 RepID=A0ABT8E7R6_9BACL|nr:EutN/CcmL family microcompartment protein [Fictibacillus sp. CENA-BCM004]MDN4073930.1 EutN/CcmL family microcompartment protein [Fictibacillus sp. CENA-BCM004]
MQMGLVVGRVTATRKDEKLIGSKLLITQPIGTNDTLKYLPIIAVDTVGAGVGEKVLYVTGSMASRAAADKDAPIDAAIVGIIDSLDWERSGG